MTDKELEERVREELYMGCVEAAENWAADIQDWQLQREMKESIVEECAKCCDALQKYPATEPRHCASDIRITFGLPE